MTQLILGSQSPRRKEILSFFSLPFECVTSNFDEDSVLFQDDPAAYVCKVATGKAQALLPHYPQGIILTADTTVYQNGKIYGKPLSAEDAFQALSELTGKWHSVFTGVVIVKGNQQWSKVEETRVLFNPLTPAEIRYYHKKLHWADKAGGYAIQMAGGLAIKKIEGCYYNAMGLPINTLRDLLLNVKIELWDYLK